MTTSLLSRNKFCYDTCQRAKRRQIMGPRFTLAPEWWRLCYQQSSSGTAFLLSVQGVDWSAPLWWPLLCMIKMAIALSRWKFPSGTAEGGYAALFCRQECTKECVLVCERCAQSPGNNQRTARPSKNGPPPHNWTVLWEPRTEAHGKRKGDVWRCSIVLAGWWG